MTDNIQPTLSIALEARVDPPHLGNELSLLRGMIRQYGRTRTTVPMLVTPGMADAMLFLRFKRNRKINRSWVERLKVILKAGRFHSDIARVIFDWDGDLRDAQHRLTAVKEAGVDAEMDVVFGVDPDAFPAMDVGLKRTAGQFLDLDGIRNSAVLAAIVRMQYRIEHKGIMPDDEFVYLEGRSMMDEIMHRAILAAIRLRSKKHVILSSASLAYWMIAVGSVRSASVDEFWDRLVIGDRLETVSPIFKLREHFDRERDVKDRKVKQYLTQTQHTAWIILAWNVWSVGRTSVSFKWNEQNDLPVVK